MLSSRLLHSTDTKPPVVEWRSSFRFSTRPSKSIIQRAGGGEGETGEMTFFSPYEPMTARSASRFGKDEHVQQKRVYAGVDRYDLRVRSCCASYYVGKIQAQFARTMTIRMGWPDVQAAHTLTFTYVSRIVDGVLSRRSLSLFLVA